MRKTVVNFLDDSAVPTHRISDELGHSKVSMTQDRYLGRHLTYRQTADVFGKLKKSDGGSTSMGPDNQYDGVDGMG